MCTVPEPEPACLTGRPPGDGSGPGLNALLACFLRFLGTVPHRCAFFPVLTVGGVHRGFE